MMHVAGAVVPKEVVNLCDSGWIVLIPSAVNNVEFLTSMGVIQAEPILLRRRISSRHRGHWPGGNSDRGKNQQQRGGHAPPECLSGIRLHEPERQPWCGHIRRFC